MQRTLLALFFIFFFANTAIANQTNDTNLFNAVTVGDSARVKSLLNEGASPNACFTSTGFTALMGATRFPDTGILRDLIDAGADVNIKTTTGETALLYAVMSNNVEAVRILVSAGADINAKNGLGLTPIGFANTIRNNEMIATLKMTLEKTSPLLTESPIETKVDMDLITSNDSSIFLNINKKNILIAKNDIDRIKNEDGWNLKAAYYLGKKTNDRILENTYVHRYQLITPYTLIRYEAYKADRAYRLFDDTLVETLKNYDGVVWIWIWSAGTYDRYVNITTAPLISHVVLKVEEKIYQPLDRNIFIPDTLFSGMGINTDHIWPFPASIFSDDNIPIEVIATDMRDRRHILVLDQQKIERIQEKM